MPSIRAKIVDLAAIAGKAEKTLKTISRASTNANQLRTGAIYGSLGFGVGAGATFAALAAASMLVYAPFAVPLVGMGGLLFGILASRDGIDRANERASHLVEQAWTLRDREVAGLTRQIREARREQSPRLNLLEQKLTFLELAPPERLMEYYGLYDRKLPQGERRSPTLGPAEQQILEAWIQPPKNVKIPALRKNFSVD
jgi:hypothetical protein